MARWLCCFRCLPLIARGIFNMPRKKQPTTKDYEQIIMLQDQLIKSNAQELELAYKDRNEAIAKAKEDLISDLQNKTNDIVKHQWYVCDIDTNLDDDNFVLTHSFGTLKGMGGLE